MRSFGFAVEQADADGEYFVEATLSRIEIFEVTGYEVGFSSFDVFRVPVLRGLDHFRRAIHGGEMSGVSEPFAYERRGDSVSASDLEYAVVRSDIESLDDGSKPFAHEGDPDAGGRTVLRSSSKKTAFIPATMLARFFTASLFWAVCEDRDSRTGGFRVREFEPFRVASAVEEAFPASDDDGMHHEREFVEEVV